MIKHAALLLPPETNEVVTRIIGAAIEVHKALGPGFVESVYELALAHEMNLQGLRFERQKPIVVKYKGIDIPGQRLDLVVEERVIVELKAIDSFGAVHQTQVLSYLKATGIRIGLLINFKDTQLKTGIKRVIL
jgi:GxxExxY protein